MIDFITGTIKDSLKDSIVIDIGSLGFTLQVPGILDCKKGDSVSLLVHMHWNQDQGPSLFGFSSQLDRKVFRLIISCSGIGPKIGLAVLRDLGAEQFLEAIASGDDKALCGVDGLGPKKVEQVIVQLKRKVAKLIKSGVVLQGASKTADWQNVSDVLEKLNYSRSEVASAMKHLHESYANSNVVFDVLVRQALSFLTKRR